MHTVNAATVRNFIIGTVTHSPDREGKTEREREIKKYISAYELTVAFVIISDTQHSV